MTNLQSPVNSIPERGKALAKSIGRSYYYTSFLNQVKNADMSKLIKRHC